MLQFSSSLVESESASVVVYFEDESGSGMQAELMVPDRSGLCRRAGRSPT